MNSDIENVNSSANVTPKAENRTKVIKSQIETEGMSVLQGQSGKESSMQLY